MPDQSTQKPIPQLSGLNWPSNILHVWLAMRAFGVPENQVRFVPEIGHFAAPEVVVEPIADDPDPDAPDLSLRHPQSPRLDERTRRVEVQTADPAQLTPRFSVSVREETVMQFFLDEDGNERGYRDETVGRLAHFMGAMMAHLPRTDGSDAGNVPENLMVKPADRLAREISDRFPELVAVIREDVRAELETICTEMIDALAAATPEAYDLCARHIFERVERSGLPQELASAFADLSVRVCGARIPGLHGEHAPRPSGGQPAAGQRALVRFRKWPEFLFHPDPKIRKELIEAELLSLTTEDAAEARLVFEAFVRALDAEQLSYRRRIIRDLVEVMTTVAFSATAAMDMLWGLGWAHGAVSAIRADADEPSDERRQQAVILSEAKNPDLSGSRSSSPHAAPDALLLSITGGLNRRDILYTLLQTWAASGGALGVEIKDQAPEQPAPSWGRSAPAAPSDMLDASVFDPGEAIELWSLVAMRRETTSPTALFETAVRRLVHPEAVVECRRFISASARLGNLFSQPKLSGDLGGTAVLGGTGLFQYPGVTLYLPMQEDSGEEEIRAKRKLLVISRLLLPVCYRLNTVWQLSVARMNGGSYLHHPFQTGALLVDSWTLPEGSENAAKEVIGDATTL